MYHLIKQLQQLYERLQDEQSRNVFWARLAFDVDPSISNMMRLLRSNPRLNLSGEEGTWKEKFRALNRAGGNIILYGTSRPAIDVSEALRRDKIPFFGFCGRRANAFPNGLRGKPVISPEDLLAHKEKCYVVVAAVGKTAVAEIADLLEKNNFPKDHILHDFDSAADRSQYFEFPSLYRKGTTFIDGGCFNCEDSYRFVHWSGGEYENIIAFEPDPDNYALCAKQTAEKNIPNFQLIQAGLSDCAGTVEFDARATGTSSILDKSSSDVRKNVVKRSISIRTVAIDDIADNQTMGFIKMDIEGAELKALHGAKNTIMRDKPLLAISVYHLQGDMLAIMDYLQQLVPEYRFLLRHYGRFMYDTVLYASVDRLTPEGTEETI